jgi:hypothetical protein
MASLKYSTAPCCCKDTDVLINQLNIKDSTIIEQAETEISDISSASIDFLLFLTASLIYKIFTKHFLMIYTRRQINLDLLTPTTLTSFAQTLAKDQFVGINKSIIVEFSFMDFIKGNGLTDH